LICVLLRRRLVDALLWWGLIHVFLWRRLIHVLLGWRLVHVIDGRFLTEKLLRRRLIVDFWGLRKNALSGD